MTPRTPKDTGKERRQPTVRRYTDRTLKLLWGRSAGRCAVPECRITIYADETGYDPAVPIGQIAHAEAASDRGPRANPALSMAERNDYENLILLCSTCHDRIDGQKHTYTLEAIKQLKKNHEDWVRASLPERGKSRTGWKTILLRDDYPLDTRTFDAALSPDYIQGKIKEINARLGRQGWERVVRKIASVIQSVQPSGDSFDTRFAVFPLARVSACVATGCLLTNRPNVQLFRYDRDARSWAWPKQIAPPDDLRVHGAPPGHSLHVAFLFELSAQVNRTALTSLNDRAVYRISIPQPSTSWLQHPDQLARLAIRAREVFEAALRDQPHAEVWHVFYAGPAPGAVAVGQQLNPTMSPTVQLYEYQYPQHKPSFVLFASAPRM